MTIKNKTYYNFLRIMKRIENKGYTKEEAEKITHHIFDNYNPNGLSIMAMIDMIQQKAAD